jgi:hypothetical protein
MAQMTELSDPAYSAAGATWDTADFAHRAEILCLLPSGWGVERIVDPDGQPALVVLRNDDDPDAPTFLLYGANGGPHAATIINDVWASDRAFGNWRDAIATIAAAVEEHPGAAGEPASGAEDVSRAFEAA